MSYDKQPSGEFAESMDEHHGQPKFLANLALTLLVLAVLFALFVLFAAATHGV